MKVLLVAMDGAHVDAFNRGWTPYISSLINSSEQLNIKNDLLSRGWLEIATGRHASVTGAMYDKPNLGGALDWGTSFSINDIPDFNTSVKPIWQVLNERGYKVGVMNLPTTFPAPCVDGFFVSGGGGGAPVTQGATEELCYPKEILALLHENDYIVDDRLYQLMVDKKLTSGYEIFERLAYKNEKRTKSFLDLNEKFKVDFGFIIYKTSSVLAETILNKNAEALKHGLHAYSLESTKEKGANWFPDILIDLPNGYLTTDKESDFISEYSPPLINSALSSITRGEILSLKSHSPLAIVNKNKLEGSDGERDLTVIYDLVLRYF